MAHAVHDGLRLRAAVTSLIVGIALMGAKFLAYRITGSSAIFSDALESIVNVIAASFAVGSVIFAGRPADRDHPYGHGKIEFLHAAFEGGLVAFAAVAIAHEAVSSLISGVQVQRLDAGLGIALAAGTVNAVLGVYLLRTGKRTNSVVLIADGRHVLSDTWTTAGVVAGLVLVRATGIHWIDPFVAILVAIHLARTGFGLVRESARGLLDEEDTDLLQRILLAGEKVRDSGIIRIHHLRAIRVGRRAHVDAHLVVPEFWTIEHSHDHIDAFEERLLQECVIEGEVIFHSDPCRRIYCKVCDLPDCPVRVDSFVRRPHPTLEEATQPDPPLVPSAESPAADVLRGRGPAGSSEVGGAGPDRPDRPSRDG